MACDFTELSAYLDGEVSEAQRRSIEAHLAVCPVCRRERERLERSKTMLSVPVEQPQFHEQLMRRIESEEATRRSWIPSLRWPRLATAGAALVCVAVALAVGVRTYQDRHQPPPTPPTHLAAAADDQEPQPTTEPQDDVSAVPEEPQPAPEQEPAPPAQEQEPMQRTTLPLVLSGTVTGATPTATITVTTSGEVGTFGIDDTVLPDVTVVDIVSRQVILDHNGTLEVLAMDDAPKAVAYPPLDGRWTVRVTMAEQVEEANFLVRLSEPAPGELVVAQVDGPEIIARGTLRGNYATLRADETELGAIEGSGSFNDERTQLIADAWVHPDDPAEPVENITLQFDKLATVDQQQRASLDRFKEEVRQMYQALAQYVRDHECCFPDALADLVPDYAPSLDAFADTDVRTVHYVPGHTRVMLWCASAALPPWEEFYPSLPMRDRLLQYEAALRRLVGDALLRPAVVLEVDYSQPDVTLTCNTMGNVDIHDPTAQAVRPEDFADGSPEALSRLTALRTSCANNLKQLGLVIKMFENEHEGYTPPGWLMVYPEYCTDPLILTSPKDEPGTDSYLYLFPATNLEEWLRESVDDPSELDSNPALHALVQSGIPIALNRTDFPGPKPGRNVLFADGHVEYLRTDIPGGPDQPDLWRDEVLPYLEGR